MSLEDLVRELSEEQLKQLLKDKWDEYGMCQSCGWHGLFTEHVWKHPRVNEDKKRMEFGCVSKDAERASSHRGVRIPVKKEELMKVLEDEN